jgi:hypothetical protein
MLSSLCVSDIHIVGHAPATPVATFKAVALVGPEQVARITARVCANEERAQLLLVCCYRLTLSIFSDG